MKGILLSGGMDSIALAYWKRPSVAFTLDYGQVCAEAEIEAASVVAVELNISHEIVRVNCRSLGSGDLAGLESSKHAAASEWWPYRNQLLITLAAMRGIMVGVTDLMLATVRSDGDFADGTPQFTEAIDHLMRAQEGGIRVSTPAIALSTAELVRTSRIPFELLAWAHSCHKATLACGNCRGCYKHNASMQELGYAAY